MDKYRLGKTAKALSWVVSVAAIIANLVLLFGFERIRFNEVHGSEDFATFFLIVAFVFAAVSIAYYALFTNSKKKFLMATLYNAIGLIASGVITLYNYFGPDRYEQAEYIQLIVAIAFIFLLQLIAFKSKSILMAMAYLYMSLAPSIVIFAEEPYGIESKDAVLFFNFLVVAFLNTIFVCSVKAQIKAEKKAATVAVPVPAAAAPVAAAEGVVAAPQVAPVSAPVTEGQPQAYSPMGFIASESFVIDEKITSTTKSFNVYSATGVQVGFIRENISGGAKAARVAMGKSAAAFQAAEYLVCDISGNILMKIHKEGGFATPDIQNAYGQKLASLERGYIKTATGEKIGKFSKGLSNTIKVLDNLGNIMCTAEKKFQGAKTIFTSADKYKVTIDPSITGNNRLIALGVVLTYEMILGNK